MGKFKTMLTTTKLKPGNRVRLVGFGQTDKIYRRQLLSLGLTQGVEILVRRVAPLGCPIQLEVRGTSVLIRKHEARDLSWELISCA